MPWAKVKKRLTKVLCCSEEQLFPQETEGKDRHYTEPPYDDIYFQAIDRMNSEEGKQEMDKSDMTFEALVDEERARQVQKWRTQNHYPALWLAILDEETGELAKNCLAWEFQNTPYAHMHGDIDRIEHELIQAAAVLKAMWECGRRNGWIEKEEKR